MVYTIVRFNVYLCVCSWWWSIFMTLQSVVKYSKIVYWWQWVSRYLPAWCLSDWDFGRRPFSD